MPKSLQLAPDFIASRPTWMKVAAVIVFGIIMVAAVFLSIQDYQTSRLGYLGLPSQKLDPETTATLVGMLPQAFQIALAWIAATKRRGRALVLVLWFMAFLPDFGTDLAFKLETVQWSGVVGPDLLTGLLVWAETFLLFTFGSEFMLMFGWSNISPLVAPVIAEFTGGLTQRVRAAVEAAQEQAASASWDTGALFNMPDEGDQGKARSRAARSRNGRG